MDWEKEPIINRIARRLPKKAYRQRMTVAEWKGYFEMVYDEALIIHGVGKRFTPKASTSVLNKPKTKYISKDLEKTLDFYISGNQAINYNICCVNQPSKETQVIEVKEKKRMNAFNDEVGQL